MPLKKFYIISLAIVLGIFACKPHSHPDKKIFSYNESSGITSLDPLKATNLSNIWAVQQIYEGLLYIDSIGNLQTLLVNEWKVNDSLNLYLFTIKQDVYFQDDVCFNGKRKKMTAFDVIYSYQRILRSSASWVLKNIEIDSVMNAPMIEAVDSFHLIIHLKNPSSTFPQMLAMPQCGIVPKEAVDYYGKD